MNKETFSENFELFTDAPNGVQKLRELILQLAVQGKLVSQDPDDEPASMLFEKIRVTNKNLKKSLPEINIGDNLYELPKLWKYVRLGDILTLEYGKNLPKSKRNQNGKYPVYGSNGIVGYHDKFLIDKTAIIVGRKGSAGALNICSGPSWTTDVSYFINPPNGINLNFAFILLKSLKLETLGKGIKPGLNRNEVYQLIVSLSPLEEQKRIVAKVDQLMTLCDQLEARQQEKHDNRIHLNNAALDKLLTAPTPGEFAQHWQRICDNFDLLYDAPETVGQLRQAILQLAVQGKLVAQDMGGEPAAVLLEKIKGEKERLVKENKIKKAKLLPIIDFDEIPHNLPDNWEWVRLGEVVNYNGAKKVSSSEIPEDAWLLGLEDIEKDTSRIIQRVTFKDKRSKSTKAKFEEGDVLYGKLRPYLNKVIVADKDGFCTTEIVPLKGYYGLFAKYLMYALKQPGFLEYVNSKTYGINLPRLGTEDARSALIPLPPLEEQKRIVAKVDQLMALCDELEAGLVQAQTEGGELMEAVVHHVLAG
jgi:type I restriction enzyme S subunit